MYSHIYIIIYFIMLKYAPASPQFQTFWRMDRWI